MTLDGQTTETIAFNKDDTFVGAQLQTLAGNLSYLAANDITVTGNGTSEVPWLVTILGNNVPQITADNSGLVGSVAVTTRTDGRTAAPSIIPETDDEFKTFTTGSNAQTPQPVYLDETNIGSRYRTFTETPYLSFIQSTDLEPKTFDAQTAIQANKITLPGHNLRSGTAILYSQGTGTNIGLTNGVSYYADLIDGDTIRLANARSNARAGTSPVTLTASTGLHSLTKVGNLLWRDSDAYKVEQKITGIFTSPPSLIKVNRTDTAFVTTNDVVRESHAGTDRLNIINNGISSDVVATKDSYQKLVDTYDGTGHPMLHTAGDPKSTTYSLGDPVLYYGIEPILAEEDPTILTFAADAAGTDVSQHPLNTIQLPSHGLVNGDLIFYKQSNYMTTDTPVGGLQFDRAYFVLKSDSNHIQLANTLSGPAIALSHGVGTHALLHITRQHGKSFDAAVAVTDATDMINLNDHNLKTGDVVLYDTGDTGNVSVGGLSQLSFDAAVHVNLNADEIDLSSHGLQMGDPLFYDNAGTANNEIGGLLTRGLYYVIRVDADTIQLAEDPTDAEAEAPVDLTAKGTGTQRFNRFYYAIKVDDNTIKLALTRDNARTDLPISINLSAGDGEHRLTEAVTDAHGNVLQHSATEKQFYNTREPKRDYQGHVVPHVTNDPRLYFGDEPVLIGQPKVIKTGSQYSLDRDNANRIQFWSDSTAGETPMLEFMTPTATRSCMHKKSRSITEKTTSLTHPIPRSSTLLPRRLHYQTTSCTTTRNSSTTRVLGP